MNTPSSKFRSPEPTTQQRIDLIQNTEDLGLGINQTTGATSNAAHQFFSTPQNFTVMNLDKIELNFQGGSLMLAIDHEFQITPQFSKALQTYKNVSFISVIGQGKSQLLEKITKHKQFYSASSIGIYIWSQPLQLTSNVFTFLAEVRDRNNSQSPSKELLLMLAHLISSTVILTEKSVSSSLINWFQYLFQLRTFFSKVTIQQYFRIQSLIIYNLDQNYEALSQQQKLSGFLNSIDMKSCNKLNKHFSRISLMTSQQPVDKLIISAISNYDCYIKKNILIFLIHQISTKEIVNISEILQTYEDHLFLESYNHCIDQLQEMREMLFNEFDSKKIIPTMQNLYQMINQIKIKESFILKNSQHWSKFQQLIELQTQQMYELHFCIMKTNQKYQDLIGYPQLQFVNKLMYLHLLIKFIIRNLIQENLKLLLTKFKLGKADWHFHQQQKYQNEIKRLEEEYNQFLLSVESKNNCLSIYKGQINEGKRFQQQITQEINYLTQLKIDCLEQENNIIYYSNECQILKEKKEKYVKKKSAS